MRLWLDVRSLFQISTTEALFGLCEPMCLLMCMAATRGESTGLEWLADLDNSKQLDTCLATLRNAGIPQGLVPWMLEPDLGATWAASVQLWTSSELKECGCKTLADVMQLLNISGPLLEEYIIIGHDAFLGFDALRIIPGPFVMPLYAVSYADGEKYEMHVIGAVKSVDGSIRLVDPNGTSLSADLMRRTTLLELPWAPMQHAPAVKAPTVFELMRMPASWKTLMVSPALTKIFFMDQLWLDVRDSEIHKLGLFVARDFKKSAQVCFFVSEVCSKERGDVSNMVMSLGASCLDAKHHFSGKMNTSKNPSAEVRNTTGSVFTRRSLKAGDELTIPYGRTYIRKHMCTGNSAAPPVICTQSETEAKTDAETVQQLTNTGYLEQFNHTISNALFDRTHRIQLDGGCILIPEPSHGLCTFHFNGDKSQEPADDS